MYDVREPGQVLMAVFHLLQVIVPTGKKQIAMNQGVVVPGSAHVFPCSWTRMGLAECSYLQIYVLQLWPSRFGPSTPAILVLWNLLRFVFVKAPRKLSERRWSTIWVTQMIGGPTSRRKHSRISRGTFSVELIPVMFDVLILVNSWLLFKQLNMLTDDDIGSHIWLLA